MKGIISRFLLGLFGWGLSSVYPTRLNRAVIIMAPHTSNFDFIFGRLAAYAVGIRFKYLIKHELFFFPLNIFFKLTGGIPINRSKSLDSVSYCANLFSDANELCLLITPEGTRSRVDRWKTGFYHIAVKAKVPVLLVYMDYKLKEVGLGYSFIPKGDFEKDMKKIQDFYLNYTAKYPEKYNSVIF